MCKNELNELEDKYCDVCERYHQAVKRKIYYRSILNELNDYNNHLIEHAKYHLNLGHLNKIKKIIDKMNNENDD